MRTTLVLDALRVALGQRRPGADVALVHHSDRARNTRASTTPQTLAHHGVLGSVGAVGDAYDHALAESFVDSVKTELIADRVWHTRSQLELSVLEYIGWLNHSRRTRRSAACRRSRWRPSLPGPRKNLSRAEERNPTNPVSVNAGSAHHRLRYCPARTARPTSSPRPSAPSIPSDPGSLTGRSSASGFAWSQAWRGGPPPLLPVPRCDSPGRTRWRPLLVAQSGSESDAGRTAAARPQR